MLKMPKLNNIPYTDETDATLIETIRDNSFDFAKLADFLRSVNDARLGIISQEKAGEWVRDASNASSASPNTPEYERTNMLQRALGRFRAISYALNEADAPSTTAKLQKSFIQLMQDAAESPDPNRIKKLETDFNTQLVQALHEHGLTMDCDSAEAAEKLLFHYRNLSALLDTARPMVTITYDDKAKVYHRETQYPVTKKTNAQHKEMEKAQSLVLYPREGEVNWHSSQSLAYQKANNLFYELLQDDTRMLPAQSRKAILPGVKNAFVVKVEIFKRDAEDAEKHPLAEPLIFARTGSPVYVGKGTKDEMLSQHTQENFEQIRLKVREVTKQKDSPALHFVTLNTDIWLQDQTRIVKHVRESAVSDSWSYVPTNVLGTTSPVKIAEGVTVRPKSSSLLQAADRANIAAEVAGHPPENQISVIHCASGQDRTGTVAERMVTEHIKQVCDDNKLNNSAVSTVHAQGGNNAEITTWMVAGSPGMKRESAPKNILSTSTVSNFFTTQTPTAQSNLYRKSADTNKKNKVEDVSFLQNPHVANETLNAYLDKLNKQQQKLASSDPENPLVIPLKNVISAIADANREKSEHPARLCQIARHVETAIKEPANLVNIGRLEHIAQTTSAKPMRTLRILGAALMILAGAALVAAGILAAIPSGGSSLLVAIAGAAAMATGLSTAFTLMLGVTAIGAIGLTGGLMREAAAQKALSEVLGDFTDTVKKETEVKQQKNQL